MDYAFCRLEKSQGIATVTLNRPEKLNALHLPAHLELDALFRALALDPEMRAVIVTGTGRGFCAGFDLGSAKANVPELPPGGFGGLTSQTDYPLPLIAAVNGIAMGGGFELALACDLIVAAENAVFALPEPKVGWAALGGGLQRLTRAIGTKRAMGVILTGRTVPAQEGLQLGFVNQVVAAQTLQATAQEWAKRILDCAPLAVRVSKQVGYASMDQPDLATALDLATYPAAMQLFTSQDATEGRQAFAERRKPRWTGR